MMTLHPIPLLKERDMTIVRLGTGSWNTAMRHTAESVGYEVVGKKIFFERGYKS